jgi:hypothetical protein
MAEDCEKVYPEDSSPISMGAGICAWAFMPTPQPKTFFERKLEVMK